MNKGSIIAYGCILTWVLLSCPTALRADGGVAKDVIRGRILFEHDRADLDHALEVNLSAIDSLVEVSKRTEDPLFRITSVDITGWSSPDGNSFWNVTLAGWRADCATRLMAGALRDSTVTTFLSAGGVDWNGLVTLLEGSSDEGFSEAAQIIRTTDPPYRRNNLKVLRYGRPWGRMMRELFPLLRRADITVTYEHSVREEEKEGNGGTSDDDASGRTVEPDADGAAPMTMPAKDTSVVLTAIPVVPDEDPVEESCRPWRPAAPTAAERREERARRQGERAAADTVGRRPLFAVGTNLLYDVLVMPSVNVEVPIRNRVSLYADHVCPWWVFRNNATCLQNLHTKAGVRVWLGDRSRKRSLEGWWVGINGGAATGDFEPDGKGYQWQAFGGSFEGGYQFAFGRAWRFGLGLDVGYYRYRYDYYEGYHDNRYLVWQRAGAGNWFGPTAVHFDLKYLIYHRYRRAAR